MEWRPQATIPRWLLMAVLAIGAFTTTLNTVLLSPLLKLVAVDFGVSNAAVGQLAALTAACAGVTALVAAPWLDRCSRGAWLRFESLVLGAGTLLSVLAPRFGWLFLGRALAGVGGAVIFAVCLAAVGDIFPDPAQRNRAIGVVGTAATLGVVAGLPVATQLANVGGWRWAMATMLPFAVVLFAGASVLPDRERPSHTSSAGPQPSSYGRILANRNTASLLGGIVVLCAAWFGWLIYFGAYAESARVGAGVLSLLFFVGGGAEVVANNLTPVLLEHCAARTVVLGAIAGLSADLLAIGTVDARPWTLFPFIAVASLASVVLFTSLSILLLDSQPAMRGGVMALQSAGFEVGGALGATIVGLGVSTFGDFGAAYRFLGLGLPLLLVPLVFAGDHRLRTFNPDTGSAEALPTLVGVGSE